MNNRPNQYGTCITILNKIHTVGLHTGNQQKITVTRQRGDMALILKKKDSQIFQFYNLCVS